MTLQPKTAEYRNDARPPIRQLLGASLGHVITPELAARIELAARTPAGQAIDLTRFAAESHETYSLQAERFERCLAELDALHREHWQETEKHRHGIPFKPDYDALLARERSGSLMQFTARSSDGTIAGHVRMFLGMSLHTQTVFAEEDTLFMRPEHRGGFLVIALMKYAERALRDMGAREIRADSKLLNRADVLMRRLGYTPVALKFHKFLED